MNQWRSEGERIKALEKQIDLLKAELQQHKEANQTLQQQYQSLKLQNERLIKKEAEHQASKSSLMEKRVIFSRAVILVPQNLVIGDRLENCTIKIYRGNSVTITDTAQLINCRIVGLDEHYDDRAKSKTHGTIEIKGFFYNTHPTKFAINTYERVLISPGARFRGNICANTIVITEHTKVRGRFASRETLNEWREARRGPAAANEVETANLLDAKEADELSNDELRMSSVADVPNS